MEDDIATTKKKNLLCLFQQKNAQTIRLIYIWYAKNECRLQLKSFENEKKCCFIYDGYYGDRKHFIHISKYTCILRVSYIYVRFIVFLWFEKKDFT